jgi:hypothetical protein
MRIIRALGSLLVVLRAKLRLELLDERKHADALGQVVLAHILKAPVLERLAVGHLARVSRAVAHEHIAPGLADGFLHRRVVHRLDGLHLPGQLVDALVSVLQLAVEHVVLVLLVEQLREHVLLASLDFHGYFPSRIISFPCSSVIAQ